MCSYRHSLRTFHLAVLACLLSSLAAHEHVIAGGPGQSIIPMLQDRLRLTEVQVRGALGALLVFAPERLPKPDFDDLAETIPNAERIMQEAKLDGIVTRPLDRIDDYERDVERNTVDVRYRPWIGTAWCGPPVTHAFGTAQGPCGGGRQR